METPKRQLETKQEAQLMLTNLRDAFRGQSRSSKPSTIQYVRYSFLLYNSNFVFKTHRFADIRLQKCRDLENRVRGPSRSLEISPCDKARMTSYWRSIVTMALSCVVSDIFNVKKCRDLEMGSKVTHGHWEWYHSIDRVWFPISVL